MNTGPIPAAPTAQPRRPEKRRSEETGEFAAMMAGAEASQPQRAMRENRTEAAAPGGSEPSTGTVPEAQVKAVVKPGESGPPPVTGSGDSKAGALEAGAPVPAPAPAPTHPALQGLQAVAQATALVEGLDPLAGQPVPATDTGPATATRPAIATTTTAAAPTAAQGEQQSGQEQTAPDDHPAFSRQPSGETVAGSPVRAEAPVQPGQAFSGLQVDVMEGSGGVEVRPQAAAEPQAAALRPATGEIAMQLQGELGIEGRLRVALRGDALRVVIHASDPRAAAHMEARMDELRQSLSGHGFTETRIEIRTSAGQGSRAGEGSEDRHRDTSRDPAEHGTRQDPHKTREDARRRAFLEAFGGRK